ncbi:MAG: YceI family protein [Betaproteobacteria bacterium]|nr:YceI family protein [Betaproteobacteria bacterium]
MKKFAVLAVAAALPLAAAAAPENYTFDPYHSFVNFAVDHVGFSTMYGRFNKAAGKMTVDAAAKTGSVEFTIETTSVDTGDGDKGGRPRSRDDHLRTADFFNVAEFPRMTYKSTGVKFSGDNATELEGQATLLGVTKPVMLKVDRWKCGPHPFSKKAMCGGNASGTIKRSDFGMKFGVPAIGDEVKLYIGFEAYKD